MLRYIIYTYNKNPNIYSKVVFKFIFNAFCFPFNDLEFHQGMSFSVFTFSIMSEEIIIDKQFAMLLKASQIEEQNKTN